MSKIDLNEFKSRVPSVKDAIRKTLKVDAGTQSTLDIMASSHGFKDYHSVKSKGNLPHYELRANLGTREKPFYITLELGHFVDRAVVDMEARDALKGCQQFQTWFLYCDGENTHAKYETAPTPERGLVYQIEVTGDTLDDVEMGIEEMTRRLDNVMGFDRNETGSFSFRRAGEECNSIEDTLNDVAIKEGPDYMIFDDSGNVVKELYDFVDESEVDDFLSSLGADAKYSKKRLISGMAVSSDALREGYESQMDTALYHVIGQNNGETKHYFKGNVLDVVEELKANAGVNLRFWVYEEMGVSEPKSDDAAFLEAVSNKMFSADQYALIDDNGIVFSSDDEQKIEETFNFAHDDLEDWEGTLKEAYKITPEQILSARNEESTGCFIVVSMSDSGDSLETYSGSPSFIVELCLTSAFKDQQLMFFKQVRSR